MRVLAGFRLSAQLFALMMWSILFTGLIEVCRRPGFCWGAYHFTGVGKMVLTIHNINDINKAKHKGGEHERQNLPAMRLAMGITG